MDWWAESVAAHPGIEDNVRRLARALEAAGDDEVAAQGYARALELNPFDGDARMGAATLALRRGDAATFEALLSETRQFAAAAPELAPWVMAMEGLPAAAPATA